MQHRWTIPCQASIVDEQTGLISLINVLDSIQFVADDEPDEIVGLPIPMHIVTAWERTNVEVSEKGHARVSFVAPNNAVLINSDYDIDLESNSWFRFSSQLPVTPFNGSGTYRIIVSAQNKAKQMRKIAEVSLFIGRQIVSTETIEQVLDES